MIHSSKAAGRFWFERPGDDLPFYNGRPVRLSLSQWLFVLVMVVLGFATLILSPPPLQHGLAALLPATLFFAIPLAALAMVAPRGWRALFRKVGPRDVAWMFGFAVLNMAITMLIGFALMQVSATASNPAITGLAALPAADQALFFLKTIPQLFGEELNTILPFLAVMTLLSAKVSRRQAILGAWIASAALFGAAHLPTYGWNFVQCFVVIGAARLILTAPYVMTRNIWVSTGAHIINDWTFLGFALFAARA